MRREEAKLWRMEVQKGREEGSIRREGEGQLAFNPLLPPPSPRAGPLMEEWRGGWNCSVYSTVYSAVYSSVCSTVYSANYNVQYTLQCSVYCTIKGTLKCTVSCRKQCIVKNTRVKCKLSMYNIFNPTNLVISLLTP